MMSMTAVRYGVALAVAVLSLAAGEARAQAGLLTGGATKLEPITLSSGNRWRRNVEGTLPGGAGPDMRFRTFSGDLTIRSR